MTVEVALVFKAVSFAHGAAKYLGIVTDKLAAKIDQLAGSDFEAGMRALEQAAKSEREQQSLLREARSRFNKAVSLEKGLRLALVYLGLALCHWHLGDRHNAKQALDELLKVKAPELSVIQVPGAMYLTIPLFVVNKVFGKQTDESVQQLVEVANRAVGNEIYDLRTLQQDVQASIIDL